MRETSQGGWGLLNPVVRLSVFTLDRYKVSLTFVIPAQDTDTNNTRRVLYSLSESVQRQP